ncbi:DUF342 domain-containing protein [Cohnella pontilimi]|uniref:DUF342 domain-containing protein n=1 Tax=Cohnella pontilimi TaxID=2564100 RepID=A0A4U0FBF5_9BACL|nr:FapA family protein [Cohnella pontilimi]TJY41938.1 DUF342 domain-containing protein [Cohnella pontilimi]
MSDHISEQEILNLIKRFDHEHEDDIDETIDGYVKVEQGKIMVRNPSHGGMISTIRAISPLKLFVDGKMILRETEVYSDSKIEWGFEEKPLFEVSVSEDKIEVYLTIFSKQRYALSLAEMAPSLHATFTAEEDLNRVLEMVDLKAILAAVEKMNIAVDLDMEAIRSEVLQPSFKPIMIARGKAPIQGRDARLELYFSENIESVFTEVRGLLDFKNHLNIPSVKSGDVIAKKIPLVEGQPGYDVFGNVLLPDPGKDIRIAGKDHVEITPDSVVIARKEGRPRILGTKIKYFDINTAHIVPGNVDLQTGNIVFAGDVIVYGDVMDNMIIESLGNIYVAGSVFNSTLTATGSIMVKGNVIGSQIYSGYFGMLYNRLYHSSKQLMDNLEKMMESARLLLHEIEKKNMRVRYGQVLLLISESKFQQVGDVVKELLKVIASIRLHNKNEFEKLSDYLEFFLHPTKMVKDMTAHRMKDFMHKLKEAYMRVALSQESHVQIQINHSQNSTLKSNGDILIRREGVIQCDVQSSRNIIFFLDNSVCRGSTLEAGDTISAMYVGGMTGVASSLKAANKIMVKKMFEGRIIVDQKTIDIYEPVEEKTFDSSII